MHHAYVQFSKTSMVQFVRRADRTPAEEMVLVPAAYRAQCRGRLEKLSLKEAPEYTVLLGGGFMV